MAVVKISALTALGAAPATNDLLVGVDVSDTSQAASGTTKKLTVANLAGAIVTNGTWTPVIGGSGGTSGQVYSAQTGRWTKFVSATSNLIVCHFDVQLSTKGTITTDVQIQGFPVASVLGFAWQIGYWDQMATTILTMPARNVTGTTVATLYKMNAAATASFGTPLATADISNTTRLIGSVAYDF